jgi:hypothetical protein
MLSILSKYLSIIFFVFICINCSGVNSALKEDDETAKKIIPPEGKSVVYFIGTEFSNRFEILINRRYVGAVCRGKYIYSIIAPGTYLIKTGDENSFPFTLTVEADKKYYVHEILDISLHLNFGLLNGQKGLEILSKCELSSDCAELGKIKVKLYNKLQETKE